MWHKQNNTMNNTVNKDHEHTSNENDKNKNISNIYNLSNNMYGKTTEIKSVNRKANGIDIEKPSKKEELLIRSKWNVVVAPKNVNTVFQVIEILRGIREIFHKFDKELKIMKSDATLPGKKELCNEEEIPTERNELEKYVENPRTNNNGKLIFRISMKSKTDINKICNQPEAKQWLIDNKIKLFESKLITTKAMFVGFFDEPNPNKNCIPFLELKINQHIGKHEMDYQIDIRPLYIEGKGESCNVYMLLSCIEDATLLKEKLSQQSEHLHKFYSWSEYQDLSRLQKLHIIMEQKTVNKKYKSTIIKGFKEVKINETSNLQSQKNHDTSWDDSEMEISGIDQTEDDSLEYRKENESNPKPIFHPTKIEKFISSEYTLPNGEQMIKGITGPVKGHIQVWYGKEALNQTLELIQVLKTELARKMSNNCIKMTFDNATEIISEVENNKPWLPNSLLTSIPTASHAYATKNFTKVNRTKKSQTQFQLTETNYQETNIEHTKKPTNSNRWLPAGKTTISNQHDSRDTNIENQNTTTSAETEISKHGSALVIPIYEYRQETKMEQFCIALIKKTTDELKTEMNKNSASINQIKQNTTNEIDKVRIGLETLKDETQKTLQEMKMESKNSTDTMIKNQETLMKYLMKEKENTINTNQNETRNVTREERKNKQDIREENEVYTHQSKQRPERTATPFGYQRSRCNNEEHAAKEQ
jgi:hypothetical protein